MVRIHQMKISRALPKMERAISEYKRLMFNKLSKVHIDYYESSEEFYNVPQVDIYSTCETGTTWGREGSYAWFKGK